MNKQLNFDEFCKQIVSKKIVIFGASDSTYNFLVKHTNKAEDFYFKKEDIIFICDNNEAKWNTTFFGYTVYSPEHLLQYKDELVILVVTNHFSEVYNQVDKMGFGMSVFPISIIPSNPYLLYIPANKHFRSVFNNSLLLLTDVWNDYGIIGYLKCIHNQLNTNIDSIKLVYDLLSDSESKDIYNCILNNRKTLKWDFSNIVDLGALHYFNKSILSFSPDEVYADVGVWTPTTINDFVSSARNVFKKIYAFEPNKFMYQGLLSHSSIQPLVQSGKLELFNLGLFDHETTLNFDENGGSSRIDNEGSDSIKVVALDELALPEAITFIKMDIEGAELAALKGSSQTIKKYKPKLAISIYHNLEHLWEIPLYIHELVPEYRLYIRHYDSNACETVLYATI